MAEKNGTCQPADEEKRKREMAILEELTHLARMRTRHNTTFVGQEEGDIAEKASGVLEKDIEDAEKCLDDRQNGEKR